MAHSIGFDPISTGTALPGVATVRVPILSSAAVGGDLHAMCCETLAGHTERGVTLIELLVALTVLAILLAIAVPSFTSVVNGNRLTSNANELVAAISYGRIEALRRSQHVVLCRSDIPNIANPVCTNGGNIAPWLGWITFVDVNNNLQRNGTETVLRTSGNVAPVVIYANPAIGGNTVGTTYRNRIVFWSDGMARLTALQVPAAERQLVNATLRVCHSTTLPLLNYRDVSLDAGSRTSIASATLNPCAAPGNPP